jgi:hypothetical protein
MASFDSISMRSVLSVLLCVAALALLSGCKTMNVSSDGRNDDVLIQGYDVVAYFTLGKPTQGDPAVSARHNGATLYFANETHRQAFLKEPDRYMPKYNGFCSNGAAYAIYGGGDGPNFEIIDGRLYIFGGPRSRLYFLMDRDRNLKLADGYWESEGKHMTSARLQSWKRLVFRVPHYKTNRELAAEYEARFGKKPGA